MWAESKKEYIMRKVLHDVYEYVNWAYLAKNYFGKSRSWIYHKFDGVNNGYQNDFSEADKETLKNALYDIAEKVRAAADRL